jgi:hypothetical protein
MRYMTTVAMRRYPQNEGRTTKEIGRIKGVRR